MNQCCFCELALAAGSLSVVVVLCVCVCLYAWLRVNDGEQNGSRSVGGVLYCTHCGLQAESCSC